MHGPRFCLDSDGGFACGGVVVKTQESTSHALAHRRAEGGRVLGGMVLRRRRMRGCRREVMCRRRGKSMRRTAVHVATASNFVRADGSGCGACGGSIQTAAARETAAATARVFRWSRPRVRLAATKTRVAPPPEAQPCYFSKRSTFFSCVRIVKGTASAVVSETECSEERVGINLARSKTDLMPVLICEDFVFL